MENLRGIALLLIMDLIPSAIIVIDEKGTVICFNKSAEKIFGLSAREVLSRYILDVLPNPGTKLLKSLETGEAIYSEKIRNEAGTFVMNISPVKQSEKILGIFCIVQDMSELDRISKEFDQLKNMRNLLEVAIDSAFDGFWISDHEGKVIRINKASERLSGVKAEEVVGRNIRELLAEGLYDKSATLEVLKMKAAVTLFQQVRGGRRVLLTGNPIFDEKGEVAYIVVNSRDVSELDQLRSQLQETQALARSYISKLSEAEMKGIDFSTVIFRSEQMEKILEMALKVAKVNSTVLLLGESGVGKGLIAKLIHKNSERGQGPFIRVDCAGIPDSLIESELFGYEKGAFTGAKSEGKPGFLELANQGTLFLDEIGEIPLSSQSKLLRFLEDHEILRLGGTEPRKIDARIVAATNRNIEEMVSSKLFRKDLYYRLNVIPINIPPLRERRDDILPLIFNFLGKFNELQEKKRQFSSEAVEALCRYDYPGNTRELANIVERVVVVAEEDRIGIEGLPNTIVNTMKKDIPYSSITEGISLKDVMKRYEQIVLEREIKRSGSLRKAAQILKVDHTTISRKIKKYRGNGAIKHLW